MTKRLPAEWEKQRCVMLVFPTKHKDWQHSLAQIQNSYLELIAAVCKFQECHVICDDATTRDSLKQRFENVTVYDIKTNDTWIRDFGAIECFDDTNLLSYDFTFNAWGGKFVSNLDNQVNSTLESFGFFQNLIACDFVLEGGSIDSNGKGILLGTTKCLHNPNRNAKLAKEEIHSRLHSYFGLEKLCLLRHGELAGDDTDAHVDTLARFVDENTIAYAICKDKDDIHYNSLKKMEKELQKLPFDLIPLPLPKAIFYKDERLPATYLNFLFVNGGLIVPTYGDKNDSFVLATLQKHLANRVVTGVDSSIFIREHGSLHCATMNFYTQI